MKFYLAPLEGITGYIYRNAFHTYYGQVDKYFSPFITTNSDLAFKNKDIKDIHPDNNKGMVLIPQLLTNNASSFISASEKIKQYGYNEINLNLGCPSCTVVSKNKGSGFLALKEELDRFLEEIFEKSVTEISIKTRIGKEQPEEFYDLIQIYNKYPLKELIIHPRIQKDFYKNKPNLTVFADALKTSKNPVCYNGDIFTLKDFKDFNQRFPEVDTLMLGRGLLAYPGLIAAIKENKQPDKEVFRQFHDRVYEDYRKVLAPDRNVLFKMKELWIYMSTVFTDYEKYLKKIKKSEQLDSYEETVEKLFREQEIVIE